MIIPNQEVLEQVRRTRERLAGDALSPPHAKLYSQFIRLGLAQPGLPSFTPGEAGVRLQEALLLVDAAIVERLVDKSDCWRQSVKRAAEILEWLSHPEMIPAAVPVHLLSAAAYQLAGYPALARGLLTTGDGISGYSKVLRSLLEADFPRLHELALSYLHAEADGVSNRAPEISIESEIVSESIRSLAVLAAFMRWGDPDRMELALAKLTDIGIVCTLSRDPFSGLVARLCALVGAELHDGSLWPWLERLGSLHSEEARAAYRRYGRLAYLKKRSLAWRSQLAGLDRLATDQSFVLCTPTGSGKTTIAELALIGQLFPHRTGGIADLFTPVPLALYLVPSRALASEVEARMKESLASVGPTPVVVTGLYGGTDWGPTDAWLTSSEPTVLVCTYEKAEALLRFLGTTFVGRVNLVVIDEAHSVQFDGREASLRAGENRALRLETLGTRLLRVLDGKPHRVIALSAVTAGMEGPLAQWLVGNDSATPAKSTIRSTRQLVGRLECRPGGHTWIRYDVIDRKRIEFSDTTGAEGPFIPQPFPPHPPAPSFPPHEPLKRLRPYLLWSAIHLARVDEDGHGHSVLMSISKHITSYATSFLTLLEEDWAGQALPRFFVPPTDPDDKRAWDECLATAEDYFTKKSPEYRLLAHGIAVHHGRMPGLMARRLKTVIERGIARLVLATSTLTEGVNLPVEYILVPDLYRDQNNTLSVQEFLNLIGRAGRPGVGTEGRTLVLVPPDPGIRTDRQAFSDRRLLAAYSALIKDISATTTSPTLAASPLARLLGLLREEWEKITLSSSEAHYIEWLETTAVQTSAPGGPSGAIECLDSLDATLLAAVEEIEQLRASDAEMDAAQLEDELRAIWRRSYARVAASDVQRLEDIFLRRGKAIPQLYPTRKERRRLYKTSLPPRSARQVLDLVTPISDYLKTGSAYGLWEAPARMDFVQGLLALLAGIGRFAPPMKVRNTRYDWRSVLRWWLNPKGGGWPKPERIGDWHDYASTHLTYKMSWALGSITALALDTVETDGAVPVSLSLDDWPKSGLPWIAFWVKELLNWGTLDPVAAFVLAHGRALTRQAAEALAVGYYDDKNGAGLDGDALLDPRNIREWLGQTQAISGGKAFEFHPGRIEVKVSLSRPAHEFKSQTLRVVPMRRTTVIDWLDIAGYLVATSSASGWQGETWSGRYTDFILDVERATVLSSPYVPS